MLEAARTDNHVRDQYIQASKYNNLRPALNEGQHNQGYQQIDRMALSL